MPPRSLNGSGHFLATDGELAERVESLSLETAASITRKSSLSQRMGSLQSMPSSVAESILPVSDNGRTAGMDDESAVEARNAVRELPAVSTSTGKKTAGQMQSPSWEEKGKSICTGEDLYKTPPRVPRPPRGGIPSSSKASSMASSPRSGGPSSSFKGSPTKRHSHAGSLSPYASPDVKTVTAALGSKSPDAQIKALKKLRFDVELCRCLADQDKGTALLVGLAEPARSWLPTFGCSDVQTTAAAALASMAKVSGARTKISSARGIPALVHILNTGSQEAQSHAATALGILAQDPSLSFQVGQAGGCAPLVRMLTSATALHSSFASFQITTDHEEAQANAASALAALAATAANKEKIVEAGGVAPLVLLLSSESAGLQASAAGCLHSLAVDPDIASKIAESGALDTLLSLLESKDTAVQAAAADAVGFAITSERMAASAIPHLVKMLAFDTAEVRVAGARSLANLAHNSTINKVKISEEAECVSYLMQQLQSAEMQLKLAARLDSLKSRQSEAHLLTLLEGVLGNSGARSLAKLAHQVKVPLGNGTDVPKLVDALKSGAAEEQLAVARLVSSLSTEEFSQSRILDAGINFLMTFTRVLRSESSAARGKAAAALANLASVSTEAVRRTACEESLVLAAKGSSEARLPALRCLLNLTEDEDCLDAFVTAGCIPVLLSALATSSAEVQRLAASALANIAISPKLREMVVKGGGIPLLVDLLSSTNVKVQAASAAALWQLCGERQIVEEIGTAGGPRAAVHALQAKNSAVQENAAGLVASLAQSHRNAAALTEEGAIEHLVPLLRSRTTEIQVYAADSLRCIAGARDENRLLIAGSSISTLILLLGSPQPDAQLSAAGCLSALAGNAEVRERIGQSGAIPHLVQLLRTGNPQAKVAAATALTNLAINNSTNLKEFVRAGGVPPLKQLLGSGSSAARRAAEGALSSLTGGLQSPVRTGIAGGLEDSPSSSQEHTDDPGTPSAILLKRKSWRSPSLILDEPLPSPTESALNS